MLSRYKNRVMMLLPDPTPEVIEFGTDHDVSPVLHELKIEVHPHEYLKLDISKHFFTFKNQNGGSTFFVNMKQRLSEEQEKILLSIGKLQKPK